MAITLYMDVHVPSRVTEGLRRRDVDVITSQEDGTATWPDEQLFIRAKELQRVLMSQDEDLLRIATEHQLRGESFPGVIYAHQLAIGIGDLVRDLELVAKCCEPVDLANQAVYLPLR